MGGGGCQLFYHHLRKGGLTLPRGAPEKPADAENRENRENPEKGGGHAISIGFFLTFDTVH